MRNHEYKIFYFLIHSYSSPFKYNRIRHQKYKNLAKIFCLEHQEDILILKN